MTVTEEEIFLKTVVILDKLVCALSAHILDFVKLFCHVSCHIIHSCHLGFCFVSHLLACFVFFCSSICSLYVCVCVFLPFCSYLPLI